MVDSDTQRCGHASPESGRAPLARDVVACSADAAQAQSCAASGPMWDRQAVRDSFFYVLAELFGAARIICTKT